MDSQYIIITIIFYSKYPVDFQKQLANIFVLKYIN